MNKKYIPIQNMLFQFIDFVRTNKITLEGNTLVWKLILKLLHFGEKFNEAINVQGINFGGYAISKSQKRQALAQSLINVLNLLYNDCVKYNRMDDIKNFKSSESQLEYMSFNMILKKGEKTVSYCDSHIDNLAAMGITEDMLISLKADVEMMKTYMPLPQEMIKRREEATKGGMAYGNQIDSLQIDRLDKLMESFYKIDNPTLYLAYQQAVRRERSASRKLALMGTVKDKSTNKPISHSRVLIPKAEIDHLVRGEKGGFRIPSLATDTYQVEIRAVNFIPKKITLVHNHGETDGLDVLLEPETIGVSSF